MNIKWKKKSETREWHEFETGDFCCKEMEKAFSVYPLPMGSYCNTLILLSSENNECYKTPGLYLLTHYCGNDTKRVKINSCPWCSVNIKVD